MSLRLSSAVVALCLFHSLLTSSAVGQAPLDPQSKVEPRSRPGTGQKFLEQFVGDWDVVKNFYARGGERSQTKGVCRQTMIHDGRFLQSDFKFEQGGATTTGMGIIGFEPSAGTFTSVWTDSRATRMSLRQSKDKFDGQQIVLFSRSLGDAGTDSRRSRTVTTLEDNGRRIVHRQFSINDDGTERLLMELLMTRKGEPAAGK
jgi:uncharacterized protein DUF1579